jgi:putative inorganic carbon (HCO3(-)) transporter
VTDLAGAMARVPTARSGSLSALPALVALFLLYTNAVVVGVNFHAMPTATTLIVPALLCIPIVSAALFRGEAIVMTRVVPLIVFLVAIQFLGALFALYPWLAIEEVVVSATEGLLLYLLITNAIRTLPMLRGAIWTLLTAGALLGAIGVYQRITQTFDNTYYGFAQTSPGGARLFGPIGDPNYYAQIMLALLPLAIFSYSSARSKLGRILLVSAGLLITAGAAFTFSRGAVVSLGLVSLLMVAMGAMRVRYVVLAAIGASVLVMAVPQYSKRLSSLPEGARLLASGSGPGIQNAEGSIRGRVTEMVATGLVFVDYPILGVGAGMARFYYPRYAEIAGGYARKDTRVSHNLVLGLAAEHGIPGLLAFTTIVLVTLRDLHRVRRRWPGRRSDRAQLATGLMLSLILYLTMGLFLYVAYIRYFWVLMALAGAAGWILATEDREDGAPGETGCLVRSGYSSVARA